MAADLRSSSLHGTTLQALMQSELRCVVGLELENQTDWALTSPSLHCVRGTISLPPREVLPGYKEVMVATKQSGSTFGSYGSVSWKLCPHPSASTGFGNNKPLDRRVVVMWSNPFNYNHYVNTLAVGLTPPSENPESCPDWTDLMYYRQPSVDESSLNFVRGQYYEAVQQIAVADDLVRVTGIMTNDHRAVVQIVVRPVTDHDPRQHPHEVVGST